MTFDHQDNLYANQRKHIEAFRFDRQVADVFDDMITRSVPGYRDIVSMIGFLGQEYLKPDTKCYDLGCSLGAVSAEVLSHTGGIDSPIIAVDNSEAMLERCKSNLKSLDKTGRVRFECADIRDIEIKEASFVVLNFVLQFIEPSAREALLLKIFQGMVPGGALVLSEKILFDSPAENKKQTDLHHTFKKLNGYSELEISQKRTALENVLVPESLGAHHERLRQAGFEAAYTWFRCFNFASLIAFKL